MQLPIQCMGRAVLGMVAGDFQHVVAVWTWDDSAGKLFLLFWVLTSQDLQTDKQFSPTRS